MDGLPYSVAEDFLSRFLRQRVLVTNVEHKLFHIGWAAKDDVVTTSRFILILKGSMTYRIEQQVYELKAGTQFFVPAWVRRTWTVTDKGGCELIWCEFDDDAPTIENGNCVHRELSARALLREKRRYLEMLKYFNQGKALAIQMPAKEQLLLEGLLKSQLARFWYEMDDDSATVNVMPNMNLHPGVKQAVRWMERHYAEKDVLEKLYEESKLTPNYFRKCFKEALKTSPQEFLQRLRLRHARHLILSTDWQLKRVAIEVGYGDPLYFSRLYTRFWGHSPKQERDSLVRK